MDNATADMTRHPLGGRFIVYTTAEAVAWLSKDKKMSFPLAPGNDDNDGNTFIIEAEGYLAYSKGADFKIELVGDFRRFSIEPLNFLSGNVE